jgi:hypothetical protein
MHEIAMQVVTTAFSQGFRIGLVFFFVLWGAKSIVNIIEKA